MHRMDDIIMTVANSSCILNLLQSIQVLADANVAAYESLVKSMKANVGRMWTSAEVNNVFLCNGGYYFDRWRLINKLSSHFGPSLLVFSSSGIASSLVFRKRASEILKLEDD